MLHRYEVNYDLVFGAVVAVIIW